MSTFLGVVASVVVVSLGLAVHEATRSESLADFSGRVNLAGVLLISVAALIFGLLPALLVSAPIFAVAAARGRATLSLAVMLGASPGTLLLVFDIDLAEGFLVHGVPAAVASCVILCRLGAKASATS